MRHARRRAIHGAALSRERFNYLLLSCTRCTCTQRYRVVPWVVLVRMCPERKKTRSLAPSSYVNDNTSRSEIESSLLETGTHTAVSHCLQRNSAPNYHACTSIILRRSVPTSSARPPSSLMPSSSCASFPSSYVSWPCGDHTGWRGRRPQRERQRVRGRLWHPAGSPLSGRSTRP